MEKEESSLLIGSRLAFCRAKGDKFYSGNGNRIEEHFVSGNSDSKCPYHAVSCTRKSTVHQLYHHQGHVFYAAERTFGVVEVGHEQRVIERQFSDWLIAFQVLDSAGQIFDTKEFEVAVLFASNVLRLARVNLIQGTVTVTANKFEFLPKCNIMSARMKELQPGLLYTIVGTAFGTIHIYRIRYLAQKQQQKLSAICCFSGHNGPIFDVSLQWLPSERRHILYSVGDDRSLRVWRIPDLSSNSDEAEATMENSLALQQSDLIEDQSGPSETVTYPTNQLAEVYGHGSRLLCLDFNREGIFTGSEDGTLCIWKWRRRQTFTGAIYTAGTTLSLFQRMAFSFFGAIRRILPIEYRLVLCSDTGALKRLEIPQQAKTQPQVLGIERAVLSFRFTEPNCEILYFVDQTRSLYHWEHKKRDPAFVLQDAALKFELMETFTDCVMAATQDALLLVRHMDARQVCRFSLPAVPLFLVRVFTGYASGDYVVVSLLDGQCYLFDISHSNFRVCASWTLKSRAVVLSAFLNPNRQSLTVGTRNGLLILLSLAADGAARIEQIVSGAHSGKSVTAFFAYCGGFASLGRDGQARYWSLNEGKIHAVFSASVMEIPCMALERGGKRLITGFTGVGPLYYSEDDFVLFDRDEQYSLARYNCGGGKRIWQLLYNNDEGFQFCFLTGGLLKIIKLSVYSVISIKRIPIASHITCLRLLPSEFGRSVALCGGIDGCVASFQLKGFSRSQEEISFRHISSVFDLNCARGPNAGPSFYIAAVGGRSELSVRTGRHHGSVVQLYSGRVPQAGEDDVRLVAVRLHINSADSRHLILLLLGSDGTLRCLRFDVASLQFSDTVIQKIPHSLAMFWCMEAIEDLLYVVSTCGRLFCYSIPELNTNFILHWELPVESCGLSSLAVSEPTEPLELKGLGRTDQATHIFVGADSGRVIVLRHDRQAAGGSIRVVATLDVHLATVTDIKAVYDNAALQYRVYAVGTDCRISRLVYDITTETLLLLEQRLLSISDPSSLQLLEDGEWQEVSLVAGNGIETVLWNSFGSRADKVLQMDSTK